MMSQNGSCRILSVEAAEKISPAGFVLRFVFGFASRFSLYAALLALGCASVLAQQTGKAAKSKSHPLSAAQATELRDYIHSTWQTLTRSQADCASLIDTKLTTKPALYFPADMQIPPTLQQIESKC